MIRKYIQVSWYERHFAKKREPKTLRKKFDASKKVWRERDVTTFR